MKSDVYYIYALICPISGKIRYIGKTCNPKERFRKHLSAKKKTACSKWVFSLKERELKPLFEIIKESTKENWQADEIELIQTHPGLLNHTKGGEGGATTTGMKLNSGTKISASKIGKPRHDTGINNTITKGHAVSQFNITGRLIATHLSIRQASFFICKSYRRIQSMVSGKPMANKKNLPKSVGGYVFKRAL